MTQDTSKFPDISMPDPAVGVEARDAGIAKITSRDPKWHEARVRELLRWACTIRPKDNPKFALEEFAAYYRAVLKGPEPHHPNAWGALTKHPDFKAHFATLGETRRSFHKAAKARRVLLYFYRPTEA